MFLVYEAKWALNPIVSGDLGLQLGVDLDIRTQVPIAILSNRSSLSGYVNLFASLHSRFARSISS